MREKQPSDVDALKSLPHTRKEEFFDFLRHRKMNIFALSSFTFMFFIPLAVDLFIFNFFETAAIASEKYEYLFSLIFYSMVIMIPCMIVGFVGFAGAFYVAKRMAWQEGVSIAGDFFQGIKDNWQHAVIDGLFFAIALFGLVVGGSYLFIYAPVHAVVRGIGIGALILIFLVIGMITPLNMAQSVYYTNSYFTTFRNSFSFLGLLNWRVLVTFLLTTGGVVALSAINLITLGVGLFLFAVLNSVVIILYTLMSHYAFDKYINKTHYPEMVGRGLYKKKEEDLGSQLDNKEV